MDETHFKAFAKIFKQPVYVKLIYNRFEYLAVSTLAVCRKLVCSMLTVAHSNADFHHQDTQLYAA